MRPFLTLALAGLLLPACQSAPAVTTTPAAIPPPTVQTEKFRLDASPGCAEGYPARIEEGRFINSAGGGFPLPYGHFLTSGWRGSGTAWVVGEELQAVPDSSQRAPATTRPRKTTSAPHPMSQHLSPVVPQICLRCSYCKERSKWKRLARA